MGSEMGGGSHDSCPCVFIVRVDSHSMAAILWLARVTTLQNKLKLSVAVCLPLPNVSLCSTF